MVRASALAIAAGALVLVVLVAELPAFSFAAWRMLFAGLWVRVLLAFWLVAVAAHAYLGVDSIVKDYVPSARGRLLWLMGAACGLLALVAYGVAV